MQNFDKHRAAMALSNLLDPFAAEGPFTYSMEGALQTIREQGNGRSAGEAALYWMGSNYGTLFGVMYAASFIAGMLQDALEEEDHA